MNRRLGVLELPTLRSEMDWVDADVNRIYKKNVPQIDDARDPIAQYLRSYKWSGSKRPICFITDIHADADAFVRSLLVGNWVKVTESRGEYQFRLKKSAEGVLFLLGGDCFDKGPANLRLLRTIWSFKKAGAKLEILAGNHDIRTFIGLHYKGSSNPKHAHLFARLGKKTMPLFREILAGYEIGPRYYPKMSEAALEEYFFPNDKWYDEFPEMAKGFIAEKKIAREVHRIREKVEEIKLKLVEFGMSLADVFAAIEKGKELFLEPKGEFHWFFKSLNLAFVHGPYVFVHAGLDDGIVDEVCRRSPEKMKRWFTKQFRSMDLFDIYNGSVGNCFRTKYRSYDKPLSEASIEKLHKNGIHAIVHGHLNLTSGQRIVLREGILNFECDCSLDRNTRRAEHLQDRGAAFTWFGTDKKVMGYSCDSSYLKILDLRKKSLFEEADGLG